MLSVGDGTVGIAIGIGQEVAELGYRGSRRRLTIGQPLRMIERDAGLKAAFAAFKGCCMGINVYTCKAGQCGRCKNSEQNNDHNQFHDGKTLYRIFPLHKLVPVRTFFVIAFTRD